VYYSSTASAEQQADSLNIQLLVDSIPALIHTGKPDGYLDCFNKPWLEFYGVRLGKVAGWNWTAFVQPEDVEGIATGGNLRLRNSRPLGESAFQPLERFVRRCCVAKSSEVGFAVQQTQLLRLRH
jgi:hypothetical protein